MAIGPGKYDELCTIVRKKAKAKGAVVIIIDGNLGSGFSCQGSLVAMNAMVKVLEGVLDQLHQDMEKLH